MKESRRKFLGRMAALAGGGIAAGLAASGCAQTGPTVYRYTPSGNIIDLFLAWYPELTLTGGAVELLLTDSERSVLVVRTGFETFTAVSAVCPEGPCRIELRENHFWCPCDRVKYGLDGAPIGKASAKHLDTYRTEFRETSLRIFLG